MAKLDTALREKKRSTLPECHHSVWRTAHKLRAIGDVLERPVGGSEYDGYPDLVGLGMVLADLGQELDGVAHSLDLLNLGSKKD